jgi:outer membrane protein assembly factor BamD (BamD/ComL family)
MRRSAIFAVFAGLLAVSPVFAQTAIELKKELLPKIKKAQADGKDLGQAQELYNEGDKLLKDGMNEEAVEAFKKAKTAMPKD